tara:strand:+ start:251 stop:1216 length:966 start_codon:yes stop_codon:yes gene_type:complete
MKKITLRILIISSLPFLIMIINFSIDYRGLFNKSQFVDSVVNNQLKKINQVIYVNIPEREILKNKMRKLENQRIDTIVIGSSRTLMFGKTLDLKLINFSVSSANLCDYIEIIKLLKQYNISAKNFIIEFHEKLFSKAQNERHKIFKGFNTKEKIKYFFDFHYLRENLSKKTEILNNINKNNYKLYYDGSIDYNKKYYEESLNINLKSTNLLKKEVENKNLNFDFNKITEFNSLIKKLNGNIFLYISPMHPFLFEKNIQHKNIIMEILNKVIKQNPSITIIGSLNPFEFDLKDSDFFDAIHIKPNGLKKIINENSLNSKMFN